MSFRTSNLVVRQAIMIRVIAFLFLAGACGCVGGSPLTGGDRIVGGNPTDISQVPYQLSFAFNGTHKCGAAIISADWALTSARCSEGVMRFFTVRAGSSSTDSGGSVHNVVHIDTHPDYNSLTHDYDLATLLISPPFSFGSGVRGVTMPLQGEEFQEGVDAVASGWGETETGGMASSLQAVRVPLTSAENCTASYAGRNAITDRMICAGIPAGGLSACDGDYGGPLVTQGRLVGISSFGYGCGLPNYPGVYAKISNLRDWIRQVSYV